MNVLAESVSLIAKKLEYKPLVKAIFRTEWDNEVQRIKETLLMLQYLLKDADAEKRRDEGGKNWVQEVRSIAYDIEDVIDTFLLRIEPRRRGGLFDSLASTGSRWIARCEMASKFKLIKPKIKKISEGMSTHCYQAIYPREGTSIASGSLQERRRTSPYVQETELVGLYDQSKTLVAQLIDEGETRRCVVYLVGIGGIGKTTLAMKVYNSHTVKKYFHVHEWISVTQEFALRDILQVIIKRWSVVPDTLVEEMNDAELTYIISEYLNGKRYLVVLDDIWEREAWDALRYVFPDSNNGSRVMLTTRNKEIAFHADATGRPYELLPLNPDDSWSLFCQKTFPEKNGICPPRLEELGKDIVAKCRGLPLAIIAIGGLLSQKKEESEWQNVHENISIHHDLSYAFPDSINGSRVMPTPRNKDIALYADATRRPHELQPLNPDATRPPHELQPLNPDDSWSLFCQKTFPEENGICPSHLEELGKVIVAECQGRPLAIIAIGGLLSKKKEKREWENVRKNIHDHILQEISNVAVSLSYQGLPDLLKLCFVYLVNFPKDHEFRAKELIQMWAAEGLIQQGQGLTVEESGKACLIELIQRSMVRFANGSSRRRIKSVYVEKKYRDLSISEAKEYGFLEVHSGNANAPSTARRLAIHHNDLSEYISLSRSTPFLRSVFIYTQGSNLLQREQEKFLYRGFKLLRVLCLNGVCIKELPEAIGELFHMRYLACKRTSLETLPSSIGNLPHLQTLFVSSFHDMKVPGTILEMQELRHLQVEDAAKSTYLGWGENWRVIEGHPGLDSESKLQILTCVEAGEWMRCLGKLINLRKLGIRLQHDRAYDQVLYESIPKMECLQSLSVVTRYPIPLLVPPTPLSQIPNLSKLRLEGKLEKLPESTEFPINLTKLTLAFSYLKEDPLAILEKLENLRVLRLLGASYTGKKMACVADGFRRLESLHLEALDQLEEWSIAKGAMPILSHLRIDNCRHLNMLPEGMQHVTTLENVELWNMHDEFKARLQGEGVDWQKIGHVRSIDIR